MNALDLYCGLGGWADGLMKSGIYVTGYDIVDFSDSYPGIFFRRDLLTLNDFPECDLIVASPPCTDFTKTDIPRSWQSVKRYPPDIPLAIRLFIRVYEIVGLVRPKYFIIENVRGAQKFTGKARMHIGSRYFWGNFPLFDVEDRNDVYGKTEISPSASRPALRSKIPLSISLAFGRAITEAMK